MSPVEVRKGLHRLRLRKIYKRSQLSPFAILLGCHFLPKIHNHAPPIFVLPQHTLKIVIGVYDFLREIFELSEGSDSFLSLSFFLLFFMAQNGCRIGFVEIAALEHVAQLFFSSEHFSPVAETADAELH